MPKLQALQILHAPIEKAQLAKARERFVFEEFYTFVYQMRHLKRSEENYHNDFCIERILSIKEVEDAVGFELTQAQRNSIDEILADCKRPVAMSRLLQGDVGSGKTLVAMYAMLNVALSGYQAALMAPTAILASQHFVTLEKLIATLHLPVKTAILTAQVTGAKRRAIYEGIANGEIDLIIGTQALVQEALTYRRLAFVVTDEQHRFGVDQRTKFSEKGEHPHILVMSATPIPRTLAVILYGDLSISAMRELPKHRQPIDTKIVGAKYQKATFELIRRQVDMGHQAYVVCPLIEESEGVNCMDVIRQEARLRRYFGDSMRIGILHGRMKPEEKDAVMSEFVAQKLDILVSTVVIEVGVDVPNATVMVVVDPQRFGLAQLHQLRGRVGRGRATSHCIYLVVSDKVEKAKRLKILAETSDGFAIAEEDLKQRGPGEFFGHRQSGGLDFRWADLFADADILQKVQVAIERYGDAGLNIKDGFAVETI